MDMIEKVARAIVKSRYFDCEPDAYDNDLERFYAELDDQHMYEARDDARAAIEAMREPTQEMLKAGGAVEVPRGHGGDDWNEEIGEYEAEAAYAAMIDAALAEE